MEKINSLRDLVGFVSEATENEWVYTNANNWNADPKSCIFFVITEKEVDDLPDEEVYESDSGPYLPVSVKHLELFPWMEIATLQGVIQNLNIVNSDDLNINLFIKGINHYREYDDFMDA